MTHKPRAIIIALGILFLLSLPYAIGRASERSRRRFRTWRRPGGHRARHGRRGNVTLIGSASAVLSVHTCAPEDAPPFGRAPPPSRNSISQRARVTWHPMMQMCGDDRPGLAEPAACHGVDPSRRGAHAILRSPGRALPLVHVRQPHHRLDREPVGGFWCGPDTAVSAREGPVKARPARPPGRQTLSPGVRGSRAAPGQARSGDWW